MESGTSEFFWNDNFPVVFTQWGPGEPSTPSQTTGCVNLDKNGFWSISENCETPREFICKIELNENPIIPDDLGDAKCEAGWHLFVGAQGLAHCYRSDQYHVESV